MSDFVDGRLAGGIAMGILVGLLGAVVYFGASKRRRFSDVFLAMFYGFVFLALDIFWNGLGIRIIESVGGRAYAAAAFSFAIATMIFLCVSRLMDFQKRKVREP